MQDNPVKSIRKLDGGGVHYELTVECKDIRGEYYIPIHKGIPAQHHLRGTAQKIVKILISEQEMMELEAKLRKDKVNEIRDAYHYHMLQLQQNALIDQMSAGHQMYSGSTIQNNALSGRDLMGHYPPYVFGGYIAGIDPYKHTDNTFEDTKEEIDDPLKIKIESEINICLTKLL